MSVQHFTKNFGPVYAQFFRPDWYFVKLHTHGVHEPNQDVLLGRPMVEFHEMLRDRAVADVPKPATVELAPAT